MSDPLSQEDMDVIAKGFQDMGVSPNTNSSEDFQKWFISYTKGARSRENTTASGGTPPQNPPTTLSSQHPRLPNFSGGKKGDVSFDLWKYEVECLMRERYTETTIAHSIRRSLRGEAARVVMRLGPQANITDILQKFESIYGTVDKKQKLMSNFYSAKQEPDEDVSSWGCRLEDLLSKARIVTKISGAEGEQMLKDIFYEGLKPSLKDITGHIYDQNLSFDNLRVAIRMKEDDMKKRNESRSKTEHANKISTSSELDEIKQIVSDLSSELKEVKGHLHPQGTENTVADQHFQQQHHQYPANMYGNTQNRGTFFNRGFGNYQRGRHTGNYGYGRGRAATPHRPHSQSTQGSGPICYRCGQEGHLQLGCRVILDHQKKPLNYQRPMTRRGR